MWDVHLAKLAEVSTIGVDNGRRVVVNAGQVFLVNRHDQDDVVPLGKLTHEPGRRPVGNALGQLVPSRFLFGAKVRTVKQLLQTDDLGPAVGRIRDHRDVLLDHRLLDASDRRGCFLAERRLNQGAPNDSRHDDSSIV